MFWFEDTDGAGTHKALGICFECLLGVTVVWRWLVVGSGQRCLIDQTPQPEIPGVNTNRAHHDALLLCRCHVEGCAHSAVSF